jgi:hypothetical protein
MLPDTQVTELDEIGILEERQKTILEAFNGEPLTMKAAYALYEDLAEIETALQRQYAPMGDIADAKICEKFGCAL